MVGSPAMQRRLERFSDAGFNFDPRALRESAGYERTDERHSLPSEAPGDPTTGGSWDIARRLIANYEFADPSIVRAYFDPDVPLAGRTMVLQLRALNLFRVHVGVRILRVIDETRPLNGRRARVWGWTYGTLTGHVESGEMSWEVWKYLDTGDVEFRVHALSRPARIHNPFTNVGFRVLGPHERKTFLHSSGERMNRLITQALGEADASSSAVSARSR
jgi:uncharacterized protein (UPF0548 family)